MMPPSFTRLISFDGQGIAFAAPSGTGKTTHIKLWQRLYGDRVEIINGDKPLSLCARSLLRVRYA